MPFSRLLLLAASSKKEIKGSGKDKVDISPKSVASRDAYAGEVILCFQLDEPTDKERHLAHCLGIVDDAQRCDGLVFYSPDDQPEQVICLVEMKSSNADGAVGQLISTRDHVEKLLHEECNSLNEKSQPYYKKQISRIIWKAGLYQHGASQVETRGIYKQLIEAGFADVDFLDKGHKDLRPLLTREGKSKHKGSGWEISGRQRR